MNQAAEIVINPNERYDINLFKGAIFRNLLSQQK